MAAIPIGVLLAACFPNSNEFVDRATLLREPAAQIRFPGAVELAHVGLERELTIDGPQGAFDGYILGTDADAESVRAYYAGEIERLGWVRETTTTHSTAELAAWWWCKDRVDFRLAIKDQAKAFRPEFYKGQTFRTVFDATLQSREPRMSCPFTPSPLPTR